MQLISEVDVVADIVVLSLARFETGHVWFDCSFHFDHVFLHLVFFFGYPFSLAEVNYYVCILFLMNEERVICLVTELTELTEISIMQ